jgi:hypothetical protein
MRSIILVLVLLSSVPALGATIRVAQDGSGDYVSLFDALEAAQDGDTVSIGPGEYTETRMINPSGQYEFEARGLVTASNVSVIGDDVGSVLIGPATQPPVLTGDGVHGLITGIGASGVSFSGISLRNLSKGLLDGDSAMSVYGCRFVGNYHGVEQWGLGQCMIEDSDFVENRIGIIAFQGYGSRDLQVTACSFTDTREGIQSQNGQTLVDRCEFSGGSFAVTLALNGNAVVQDCTITDAQHQGVFVDDGSTVWLYNNIFQGMMANSLYVSGGAVVGVGDLLSGGTDATIYLGAPDHLEFFGNHILNSGGLSVRALGPAWEPDTLSLTNNWWGTGDPAQIEDWIFHAPDDPANNGLTIEYLPFYGGPVPREPNSIGRLKGRFQGD